MKYKQLKIETLLETNIKKKKETKRKYAAHLSLK